MSALVGKAVVSLGAEITAQKVAAAAGLVLLMICGLWARWRVRDPWYAMAPAFVLGVVNLFIILSALDLL